MRLILTVTNTNTTMDTEKIVEKKVYEDGRKEYASEGKGNAALTLGIIGTALGVGALWGRGGFSFGGNNMPENVNINTMGGNAANGRTAPTAFEAYSHECEDMLALTNEIWGLKVNTQNQMYAHRETDVREKHELWRSQINADFGLYKSQIEADFGLYKNQRDLFDALNEKYGNKFNELDKKVAVLEATRPYQDKLIQCEIERAFTASVNYTDRKTCNVIRGQLVLPSTPTVTGYGSYNPCAVQASSSATA